MTPRDTEYRLAASPRDYARCRDLMRGQPEASDTHLTFPTVMAERAGRLLGFLSTHPSKDAVIAGPLILAPDLPRPGFVTLRLGEAYDAVMRKAGMAFYWFHVPPELLSYHRVLQRMGFEVRDQNENGTFYTRRLA